MNLTFNKNSWHLWVANFGTKREWGTTDICSYTRSFLKGLFFLTLTTIGVLFVVFGTGNMLYEFFTADKLSEFAGIFATIYGIILLFILGGTCVWLYRDYFVPWMYEKFPKKETPPGFVKQAYTSFKEKTCWRIDIK